jgi:hypothetical protein
LRKPMQQVAPCNAIAVDVAGLQMTRSDESRMQAEVMNSLLQMTPQ